LTKSYIVCPLTYIVSWHIIPQNLIWIQIDSELCLHARIHSLFIRKTNLHNLFIIYMYLDFCHLKSISWNLTWGIKLCGVFFLRKIPHLIYSIFTPRKSLELTLKCIYSYTKCKSCFFKYRDKVYNGVIWS
jgi:hypothetical protein